MLLNGLNHVAILTNDTDRLAAFYREVFDATVREATAVPDADQVRLSFFDIGPFQELNVFEIQAAPENGQFQNLRNNLNDIKRQQGR